MGPPPLLTPAALGGQSQEAKMPGGWTPGCSVLRAEHSLGEPDPDPEGM